MIHLTFSRLTQKQVRILHNKKLFSQDHVECLSEVLRLIGPCYMFGYDIPTLISHIHIKLYSNIQRQNFLFPFKLHQQLGRMPVAGECIFNSPLGIQL